MAGKLAPKRDRPQLESVANVNEARLQAKAGKLMMRSGFINVRWNWMTWWLTIQASAFDWFSYGHFWMNQAVFCASFLCLHGAIGDDSGSLPNQDVTSLVSSSSDREADRSSAGSLTEAA